MWRARWMKRSPAACWAASPARRSKPSAWEKRKCGPAPIRRNERWDGRRCQPTVPCAVQSSGSGPTDMPKVAIVAALEREVRGLTRSSNRVEQRYEGRSFVFFERDEVVVVCGGIGLEAARRAAEAVISLYHPAQLHSVGFAGALDPDLRVGDLIVASVVIDARDGSRAFVSGVDSQNSLVTFMSVAGVQQKKNLAPAFGAKAVDMEAAAVAAAAVAHGIPFAATKVISDEWNFELPEMDRFIDSRGQ